MKEYSVTKFFAETEIQDDVTISGSSMAQESFLSFSLELKNDFFVNKDLKTTKGSINAKSCLQVGGNLISSGDITVQKSCQVGGLITGNNLRFKGVDLSAQSIKAETLSMQGNIKIQNGITASTSVFLLLNRRRSKVTIGGRIMAPHITIRFGGFFSKWLTFPDALLRQLGRDRRVTRQFNISGLKITTEKLTIKTQFPPETVEIDYSGSNIEANEIEVIQVNSDSISGREYGKSR